MKNIVHYEDSLVIRQLKHDPLPDRFNFPDKIAWAIIVKTLSLK